MAGMTEPIIKNKPAKPKSETVVSVFPDLGNSVTGGTVGWDVAVGPGGAFVGEGVTPDITYRQLLTSVKMLERLVPSFLLQTFATPGVVSSYC